MLRAARSAIAIYMLAGGTIAAIRGAVDDDGHADLERVLLWLGERAPRACWTRLWWRL